MVFKRPIALLLKLNRKVIKRFKNEILKQMDFKDIEENLKKEINELKKIDNKYIIKYFDAFIEQKNICLVIEYCEVRIFQ